MCYKNLLLLVLLTSCGAKKEVVQIVNGNDGSVSLLGMEKCQGLSYTS